MKIKLNSPFQRAEMALLAERLPQWAITVRATVADVPAAAKGHALVELERMRQEAHGDRGRANAIGSIRRHIEAGHG